MSTPGSGSAPSRCEKSSRFLPTSEMLAALKKADFLVVCELYPEETAEFWQSPGITRDDMKQINTTIYRLPGAGFAEKDGTFVNHAGLAQTFPRAVLPPKESRTELQLAFDLLGRTGLVRPAAVRAELAAAMPEFAGLEEKPRTGKRLELATV